MAYFERIWCFLVSCSLTFKVDVVETANILLIEVPNLEDTALQANYDDYDPIDQSYEDYNDQKHAPSKHYNTVGDNIDYYLQQLIQGKKTVTNKSLCQRIFGKVLGNDFRCVEELDSVKNNVKNNKRSKDWRISTRDNYYGNRNARSFSRLTQFSHDYVDIEDLSRSKKAHDYLNDDSKIIRHCQLGYSKNGKIILNPDCESRRGGLSIGEHTPDSNTETSSTNSDSSSSGEEKAINLRKAKHPKRFQVISDVDNKISDDGHGSSEENEDTSSEMEAKKADSADSEEIERVSDRMSRESSSDSEEVTTKAPKRSKKIRQLKKKVEEEREYEYLQGNNMFNPDDFRRYNRLPYFLPKRYRWKEDQYHNLGSFWFNGPKEDF